MRKEDGQLHECGFVLRVDTDPHLFGIVVEHHRNAQKLQHVLELEDSLIFPSENHEHYLA